MKNKIRQNMIWNASGSLAYLGSQWLMTVLAVRMFGYGDAGIFSLAMSLTNTFYSLANYGVRNFQASDLEGCFSDKDYICSRGLTAGAAFVLCIFYCIFCGYGKRTYTAVFLFMCFRSCEALQDVYYGIEQKNSDMKSIGISNMIKGAAAAAAFLLAAAAAGSLIRAMSAMTAMMAAVLVLYDKPHAQAYMAYGEKKDFRKACRMLWTCAPVAAGSFMTNYMLAYPKLAVEREMGEESLGIYASIGTPVLIVQMAASYVFAPLVVVFAEYLQTRQKKAFFSLFLKVFFIIGTVGAAAYAAAVLWGEFFLSLLFGEEISRYAYILYPLILCTVLTAAAWFFNAVGTVCRDYAGMLAGSALGMAAVVLCSRQMIHRYSFNGASFALCIALAVKTGVMAVTFMKKMKNR